VNHLPVNLEQVSLFYAGKNYYLGDLISGEDRTIDSIFDDPKREKDRGDWLLPPTVQNPKQSIDPKALRDNASLWLMKKILFNGDGDQRGRNGGLRNLDQSWRLRPQLEIPSSTQVNYRPEIILVGKVSTRFGQASTINSEPASATRLWLGELPGKGELPPMPGVLGNDVYVRVYIPVK
jgi:hypothetical protein